MAPASFIGGPLALVKTGDEIEVDVKGRRIHLHVSDRRMYQEHTGQADDGCDFDFLEAGAAVPEIH